MNNHTDPCKAHNLIRCDKCAWIAQKRNMLPHNMPPRIDFGRRPDTGADVVQMDLNLQIHLPQKMEIEENDYSGPVWENEGAVMHAKGFNEGIDACKAMLVACGWRIVE